MRRAVAPVIKRQKKANKLKIKAFYTPFSTRALTSVERMKKLRDNEE